MKRKISWCNKTPTIIEPFSRAGYRSGHWFQSPPMQSGFKVKGPDFKSTAPESPDYRFPRFTRYTDLEANDRHAILSTGTATGHLVYLKDRCRPPSRLSSKRETSGPTSLIQSLKNTTAIAKTLAKTLMLQPSGMIKETRWYPNSPLLLESTLPANNNDINAS